jgi:hypothetical protein
MMSWPSVFKADAETRGFPVNTHASEIRYLEVGWSVQSKSKSYCSKTEIACSGER